MSIVLLLLLLFFPSFSEGSILTGSSTREANHCDISSITYIGLRSGLLVGDHTVTRGSIDTCSSTNSTGVILPPGTLSLCSLSFGLNSGTAALTFTLLEDGVATTITCVTSSGSTGGCMDTTHSVSITSGKKYAAKVERTSGTGNGASYLVVNCQWIAE